MNEITKLAIDLAKGNVGNFSIEETDNTLRQYFVNMLGTDKPTRTQFEKHKYDIFEIISVAIDTPVVEGITDQFDFLAEIRNTAWGDIPVFDVDNPNLFEVAVVTHGTGQLRRQRITNGKVTVTVKLHGIKIYEEFYRYLAGRTNWPKLVERVRLSLESAIKGDVYQAIYDSHDILGDTYSKSGVYDEAKLLELADEVEAANPGAKVMIVGTKSALRKVTSAEVSDGMKDYKNQLGYYGTIGGYEMLEVQQVHKPGTNTPAISNDFLLVIPVPTDKMVKIVFEGTPEIIDTQNPDDLSKEYTFFRAYGVAVVASRKYGIYRLEAPVEG